ncbi:MAG: pyridoxal phosphate enzyme (YggS family) [Candidatus Azotimanducaceae bacterium]
MSPFTVADVENRLARVRARIDAVERTWQHPVEVMAVTKGFSDAAVTAAAAAGCRLIGENYSQDLLSKEDVIEATGVDVHFIGRLQSNKVRQLAHLVTMWATIDRISLVDEVAKRMPGGNILLQVNAAGEEQKGGCLPADVPMLLKHARAMGLDVRGLMTVGPTGGSPEATRLAFQTVRGLVDDHHLEVCSMGMSGDIDIAIECGSTEVRVGSALFGPRPTR